MIQAKLHKKNNYKKQHLQIIQHIHSARSSLRYLKQVCFFHKTMELGNPTKKAQNIS